MLPSTSAASVRVCFPHPALRATCTRAIHGAAYGQQSLHKTAVLPFFSRGRRETPGALRLPWMLVFLRGRNTRDALLRDADSCSRTEIRNVVAVNCHPLPCVVRARPYETRRCPD